MNKEALNVEYYHAAAFDADGVGFAVAFFLMKMFLKPFFDKVELNEFWFFKTFA